MGSGLEGDILAALVADDLSTTNLANALQAERNVVYRCCCRMEDEGEIQSHLEPGPKLLYCVEHGKVVTNAIYDSCKGEGHQLKIFHGKIRIWHARPPRRRRRSRMKKAS